uniref:Uncharacterized protein LOC111126399 isoform X2 n=1 Tax=Crassostrea virginica TaxID=6565 RepID=A0A8B8DG73_CRAVI|nr:uncharacterized protein LOC111126399 isoform X2 [Crassostrea virginica]
MSNNGEQNCMKENENTRMIAKEENVRFWKDQKIWIQIAIVGVQIITFVCMYMSVSLKTDITNLTSCRQGEASLESSCADCFCVAADRLSMKDILNIASQKEFKNLLDEDWKTRQKILEEDLSHKIEKATRSTQIMKDVKLALQEMLTSLDKDWNKRNEALSDDLIRRIEGIKDTLSSLGTRVEGVDGQLHFFFSEIGNLNNYIAVFFFAMIIGGITFVYKLLINRQPTFERTRHNEEKEKRPSSGEIIEKLSRKKVEMGTLIVSFDGATHQFHRGIFKAISAKSTLPVKEAVIQYFGDLLKVEPHKLVVIFVDSNARNIILENPESEIGNFKNQATDVFISLGCDVFVVYCKDKVSQNLSPDNLYNPKLHSVESHPVLRKLKEREMVLSVNTKFHPHQVSHMESCCKKIFCDMM